MKAHSISTHFSKMQMVGYLESFPTVYILSEVLMKSMYHCSYILPRIYSKSRLGLTKVICLQFTKFASYKLSYEQVLPSPRST